MGRWRETASISHQSTVSLINRASPAHKVEYMKSPRYYYVRRWLDAVAFPIHFEHFLNIPVQAPVSHMRIGLPESGFKKMLIFFSLLWITIAILAWSIRVAYKAY